METPFLTLFHGVFGEDPLELPCNWGGWWADMYEERILKAKDKNVNGKPELCKDMLLGFATKHPPKMNECPLFKGTILKGNGIIFQKPMEFSIC